MLVVAGGNVSCRFSPLSAETRNTAAGFPGSSLVETASHRPSGDQEGPEAPANSVTGRSEPPSAGTITISALPPLRARTNAIERPSGDHAGLVSSAWSVVSRSGRPEPTRVT